MTVDPVVERKVANWDEWMDWPLMAAALAFLVAYAVPILDTDLSPTGERFWVGASWLIWGMFVVDYAVRLWLAENRKRFFVRHLLDLAVIVLPLLRPLLMLRLVTVLRVLNRHAAWELRGRVVTYILGGTSLLAVCGALAVLDAEQGNPDANISGFGDALWWAITTMSTVGYGDRYPTTDAGRVAAVMLMLGGVAMLGMVTASLASWLAAQVAGAEKQEAADLRAELDAVHAKLDQLLVRQDDLPMRSGSGGH